MKKLLAIMLALLLSSVITAHKQHVHQYLTMEAYKLLKMQLGGDVRIMKDRLGDWTSYYIGDRAWQRGYITTGAYREDEEDIVYGYSRNNTPNMTGVTGVLSDLLNALGLITPDPFVSITHFWSADQGDVLPTTMRMGAFTLWHNAGTLTVPSAYQKLNKLATPNRSYVLRYSDGVGRHLFTFNKAEGGTVTFDWCFYLGIEYNSLIEMFKTGRAWIVGYYNVNMEWIDSSRDSRLPCEVVLGEVHKNWFVWEILGRMSHLLQDMTVPAHTNLDPHGDNPDLILDYYENSFEWTFDWNYQNTFSQVGGYINPYQSSNPLHFLMYTSNQMSNHFATQGPHYNPPNDYFSGNPLPEEINYLNSLNVSSFGAPTSINGTFDQASVDNVRNHLFPQAIRATAGLLYWFAKEADLLPIPLTGAYVSGTYDLYLNQTGNWYAQPLNGLDPFTYKWEIMYLTGGSYLSSSINRKPIGPNLVEPGYWFTVGTNSPTFSRSNNGADLRNFKLRCTVKDGSNTIKISNEWTVNVYSTEPPLGNVVADNPKVELNALGKEVEDKLPPSDFSLEQNYPNPFNPTTTISYQLPKDGFVKIKVYNMLGKEIATLVNENKSAGNYEVNFDANRLTSGIYIYTIKAGKYSASKKMILTK